MTESITNFTREVGGEQSAATMRRDLRSYLDRDCETVSCPRYHHPRHLEEESQHFGYGQKTKDMLIIPTDIPPHGTTKDDDRLRTVEAVVAWITQILETPPTRPLPLIVGDLNCKFGFEKGEEGDY